MGFLQNTMAATFSGVELHGMTGDERSSQPDGIQNLLWARWIPAQTSVLISRGIAHMLERLW